MVLLSKRILLPIASSPPSKRPCRNLTSTTSTQGAAAIDLEGEGNVDRGISQDSVQGGHLGIQYKDIPTHLFTDAQHEDDCDCLYCQWLYPGRKPGH